MARTAIPETMVRRRRTIPFNFGPEHMGYIRQCRDCTFNILEGAVRSGKTIDNVFAFAHELKTAPDKLHLATGSTMANAKLNIGDANGFGLEYIFRGQCRWGRYKDNECLIIKGPSTGGRTRIVIFAGGAMSDSYKKIRGNSYGMWIATEINLHHDNTIKEAFNRQLAAKRRKIFWDLNPEHPKARIYTDYLDPYAAKAGEGTLLGGYNYRQFNIFQNVNISQSRLQEIISQYDENSIWYIRDILGRRTVAEGLVYPKLTASIAAKDGKYRISSADAKKMTVQGIGRAINPDGERIIKINVGVDFGGSGSGHAFVASGITGGEEKLIVLRSRRYKEGEPDPDNPKRILREIDPEQLNALFIRFLKGLLRDYGFVTDVYADSAESVLIRGLRNALQHERMGQIRLSNARKSLILNRIRAVAALTAQGRLFYTEDCQSFEDAVSMAVWNPKKLAPERLDDGTTDIDTLDAFEYSFEREIGTLLRGAVWGGGEAQ